MRILFLLFFCSGGCGLAYQVLWVRQLSFVFGVTAYAAGTVLAAFMTGLALGSWLSGPLLARIRRPLAAFGVVELLIGLSALATPWALGLASSLYRALYAVSPDAFALQTLARFICAFVVLLVPTMLMGLTLPLVSASSLIQGPRFASRVSALYAVNTAGAVAGALLTGFVLIGAVGVSRTFLLAALINAVVGISALALDRWAERDRTAPASPPPDAAVAAAAGPTIVWWVMAASGFASLALEVVWFRLMTQTLDATTYAFTITLAVVLLGIAAGGAISARWLRHDADWQSWLSVVLVGTSLAALLGAGILTWDEPLGLPPMRALQRVVLLVLVPTLFMGLSFPLLLRLGVPSGRDRTPGARAALVGRFYSVNVLGAIVGSLAGGFLMVPLLGTWMALVVLSAVFLVAGAALAAVHPRHTRLLAVTAAASAAFVLLATALPDPFVVAMRRRAPPGSLEIFRDDGVQTAVMVYETTFQRTLNVGGLHQANDSQAMVRLHRQIGLLPMALHPAPASALVIGLGGGATAGAVSQHPGTQVQIVELSDSVRRAAPFFSHVTYDVLNQPNVRVRVDDGRNFLDLSGETFDVITADIIQPVHAGAGHLYSREYFHLVRRALRPGGLALQWIGKREASHYKLIMRTFLDVFPHATLWLGGELMIGSLTPLTLDADAFDAKLRQQRSRDALGHVGLDSFETLQAWYAAGPREMRAFVGEGPVLTDDRPLVEYHRSIRGGDEPVDVSTLKGSVADVLAR